MEGVILKLAKSKQKISLSKEVNNSDIIIIDFLNIYSTLIKFNKNKTFSKETFLICIDRIMESIKTKQIILVSKIIFEVDNDTIKEISTKYSNLTYVMVEDKYIVKSLNLERDDYVCLLYNYIITNESINALVVSNDRFRNIGSIVKNIKNFMLHIVKKGIVTSIMYEENILNKYSIKILLTEINRVSFTFV